MGGGQGEGSGGDEGLKERESDDHGFFLYPSWFTSELTATDILARRHVTLAGERAGLSESFCLVKFQRPAFATPFDILPAARPAVPYATLSFLSPQHAKDPSSLRIRTRLLENHVVRINQLPEDISCKKIQSYLKKLMSWRNM
jgi:hypothetical protein